VNKKSIKLIPFFVILLFFCFILNCNNQKEKSQVSNIDKEIEKSEDILSYWVKKKEDYSYLNNPRMSYRIVLNVDKLPSKKQLEDTATKIWKEGNKNWKEFTVFTYLPEMDTENIAYYIGEFRQHGLIRSEVEQYALYGTKWQPKKETQVDNKQIDSDEIASIVRDYYINLNVAKIESRKIKIDISTNFPDGTNLLVDVSRVYYEKGKREKYSGDIFSKDRSVENGKVQVEAYINDSKWYNKYYADAKKFGHIMEYPGIGKISTNVDVWILFSTNREQRNDILKILGEKGEFISASGAKKGGNFASIEANQSIEIPFQK